jgi:uncharacterized membrane-anchored protein
MFGGLRVVSEESIKALKRSVQSLLADRRTAYHHNTWSTEATLASVPDSQPLLNSMGILDSTNTFHSDNVLPINADQRRNTGVYRGMVKLLRRRIELRDYLVEVRTR